MKKSNQKKRKTVITVYPRTSKRAAFIQEVFKPHVCDMCGKRFSELLCLNRHLQAHNGIKPFVCDICGAAYSCVTSLDEHQKIQFCRATCFACAYCGVPHSGKLDLEFHYYMVHKVPNMYYYF